MGIALQLLFTGLGVGSIYALVALGFVLIYRATNVVNFAQGDFAMLGAFSMVVLCVDLELPYWLGILITLAVMLVFGALFIPQSTIRCEITVLNFGRRIADGPPAEVLRNPEVMAAYLGNIKTHVAP